MWNIISVVRLACTYSKVNGVIFVETGAMLWKVIVCFALLSFPELFIQTLVFIGTLKKKVYLFLYSFENNSILLQMTFL